MSEPRPILWIVIPCYNEEQVLPITAPQFLAKIQELVRQNKISPNSRILFVNDGSRDKTWEIIADLARKDEHYIGISQSRNRGHQNAVLAFAPSGTRIPSSSALPLKAFTSCLTPWAQTWCSITRITGW